MLLKYTYMNQSQRPSRRTICIETFGQKLTRLRPPSQLYLVLFVMGSRLIVNQPTSLNRVFRSIGRSWRAAAADCELTFFMRNPPRLQGTNNASVLGEDQTKRVRPQMMSRTRVIAQIKPECV